MYNEIIWKNYGIKKGKIIKEIITEMLVEVTCCMVMIRVSWILFTLGFHNKCKFNTWHINSYKAR